MSTPTLSNASWRRALRPLVVAITTAIALVTPNILEAQYLTQDFETSFTGTPGAPAGWTQERVQLLGNQAPVADGANGSHDFSQNTWISGTTWTLLPFTTTTQPGAPSSGTKALHFQDSWFGSGTTTARGMRRMATPVVDLSGSTSPYVRFWFAYAEATTALGFHVMASNDGGSTWNSIMIINGNGVAGWQRINVRIPSAYQTANARFALEMNSGTWNGGDVYVDDFTISEFTPTVITSIATGNWNAPGTWDLGVVPTADHHVVIAAGHTVSENIVGIARCQNLTVNGIFQYGTTTTTDVLHAMGDVTVNSGGTFNAFSGATGKRVYLGGSIINNAGGTVNFSVGAANTFHVGGAASTVGGAGTFTNGFLSNAFYYNSGGVTYNTPLQVRNTVSLGYGAVNPNGNLTIGNSAVTTQTIAVDNGTFTSAPAFGTGVTRSYQYQYGLDLAGLYRRENVTMGNEIENISGTRTIQGTLTMNTFTNVVMGYPVTLGTGAAGTLTLSRGILINDATNVLTINNTASAGVTGTAPSTATPATTNGSYITGAVRINFPATGTTARTFPLGRGSQLSNLDGTPNANVQKYVILNAGATAWAGQTPTVSLEGAPSGTMNAPLNLLLTNYAYRVNTNGGPDFSSTATITLRGMNYTFGGGANTDNLLGDQSELFVAQSPSLTGGLWDSRSIATGTGAFVANTAYTRTSTATAPGPIAPLATNGQYFALATSTNACNGAPTPGNTLSTASSACPGVNFTLSLQNVISGTGVTYQWQSADDALFTVNLANLGSGTTQVTNQSAPKYYRCLVTCAGFGTTPSNALLVGALSGPCQCSSYGIFSASSTDDEDISNVTVGSMNNTSDCVVAATGAGSILNRYSNFTGSVTGPSADLGASVNFSVTSFNCLNAAYGNGFQIYVDWNQDGVFNATDERVYNQPAAATGNHTETGSFSVPLGALLGTTRMRVVNVETTFPTATNYAQTGYTWGETEDYCFTVTAPPPCTGQPTPGNTIASVVNACPAVNFTLSLQNPTLGAGVTYQWESADDALFTVNQAFLGTSNTQVTSQTTAKYYRCTVSCPSNPNGVSTPILVTMGSGCQCNTYCTATNSGTGCITNVTLGDLNNTTAGCSAGNYSLQSATTTLYQNTAYTFSMTTDASDITSVWFDWDNSGTFTAAEWYQVFTTGTAGSINITVPVSYVGQIRMRVRSRLTGNVNGSGDACTSMGSGETEDYCITIAPEPACPIPGSLTVTGTSTTTASASWTGTGSFILEYGPAATFTIPGTGAGSGPEATSTVITGVSSPYVIPGLVNPTQYRVFVRKDCTAEPNGYSPNSSGVLFYSQPPYDQCGAITSIPTVGASSTIALTGNTNGATDSEGFGAVVAWEAFTLTQCVTTLNIDYCGSTPARTTAFVNLFLGCPQSAGFIQWTGAVGPACPNGSVNIPYQNVPAGTYYIAIMNQANANGPYGINVTTGPACPGPAPTNDLCVNAEPIACGDAKNGTLVNSTRTDAPATLCSGFLNNQGLGVWYKAENLCGSVTADLCTTVPTFDSRLAIYSGSCGNLVCVSTANNTTGCGGGTMESITWAATSTETYYIYVMGNTMAASVNPFTLTLTCVNTPAAATAVAIDDCNAGTFAVNVNVSSFGSGSATINWVAVPGGPGSMPAALGTNTLPTSFPAGTEVQVNVSNGVSGCTLNLGSLYSNCPVDLVCGNTITVNHCYTNNDPRTFTFHTPNPGETVTVTFLSGSMAAGDVIRGYSGTDNSGDPIDGVPASEGNLTGSFPVLFGATGTSTGQDLFIEIDSDNESSCFDGDQSPWVFQVECTPGCVDPDGTVTEAVTCGTYSFTLDVEVTFAGDGSTVDLEYTVNGVPQTPVTGIFPFDPIITLGPFAIGTNVAIVLAHESDGACDKNLGTFNGTSVFCPPPGWTCALPLDVNSFPYSHNGTTCGSGNEIIGTQCGGAIGGANYGGGEDFVYRLNVASAGDYQISMTAGVYMGWFLKSSSNCSVVGSCLASGATGATAGTASSIVTLSAGTYYLIIDSRPLPFCGTYSLSITPYVPLPGENCSVAINIPSVPATVTGNTSAYLHNYDAVCPFDNPGGKDVVYSYTPPVNQWLNLTMCTGSTNYDTKLYVYANTCTGTPIQCNDDNCANPPLYASSFISSITGLAVTAGTTYYFVVDAYSTTDQGDYTLNISLGAAPFDPCSSIANISGCGAPTGVVTSAAGNGVFDGLGGPFATPGEERIFTFTASTTGTHTLNVVSITGGWVDFYWKAVGTCDATGWNYYDDVIAAGPVTVTGVPMAFTSGTQYYIMWDAEDTGARSVNFEVVCPAVLPDNDECVNAIGMTVSQPGTCPVPMNGTTAGSTDSGAGDPSCDTGSSHGDVWYTFNSGTSSTINWSFVQGTTNVSIVDLFSGSCGALTPVACNFSFADISSTWTVTPNTNYWVRVSYSITFGDTPGTFTLTLVGDGACSGQQVVLEFQTDQFGSETGYEIISTDDDCTLCSGQGYPGNAVVTVNCCLADGCYRLRVTDSFGDGMVWAGFTGGYILRDASNRRIIDNRFNFGGGSESAIANNEGFCLPLGNDRLIYTSCDKLDWRTTPCSAEYVVANDNPAVTAQYGVNNANSGYQMWWFDPNGGYSFRRFQSHSTTNGLPASATRACHFRINSWTGNQLQEGTLYNVRVRSRVNGVWGEFGPACRFKVDNTAADCPLTKLMDDPGNTYFVCGGTRALGSNQLVHAVPKKRMKPNCTYQNANRYQFRFRIPAENILVVKTSASGQYWVNTNGLQCGKTYEVDVRASFDNGATWCATAPAGISDPAWGDVCLLTINCGPVQGGNQNILMENAGNLLMYPNPNRGDQLFLNIDGIAAGVSTVHVDIYDAFGKRVHASREALNNENALNTVLELNGSLAAGMYTVTITAGEQVFNERLVIQP